MLTHAKLLHLTLTNSALLPYNMYKSYKQSLTTSITRCTSNPVCRYLCTVLCLSGIDSKMVYPTGTNLSRVLMWIWKLN